MKVTKYPQSCMLIEEGDVRILIDPGNHYREAGFNPEELGKIDALLYTHQHGDHYDKEICDFFIQGSVPIYCNQSTAKLIGEENCTVVNDGDSFEIGGVPVLARELPHTEDINGGPGPQNTGYVMKEIFFHPGDGKAIENLQVDNLALPIIGGNTSPHDVSSFMHQVGAKVVIPIHYHGLKLEPHSFSDFIGKYAQHDPNFVSPKFVVLADGESYEIE